MSRNHAHRLVLTMALMLTGCASNSHPPSMSTETPDVSAGGAIRQSDASSKYFVPGLQRVAEVVRDKWGVPHIYAQSAQDVFLAQGFNVAKERLFQLDLWRRRGSGLLSEVFGSSYLEQDKATRLFLYRGDMAEEWNRYGPEARMAATQFTAGINAYIDWLNRNPQALPEEFHRLGYLPAHWAPEDVVRIRSHGLTRNVASEVTRARIACVANVEADQVRWRLQPAWHTTIPLGLDPCAIPSNVLRTFNLATSSVVFTAGALRTASVSSDDMVAEGSNGWVISPQRTSTGRPILANDPHRGYSAPSLRYIAHLSAPGIDVIGAGEPTQPGISIGHNRDIAFGLTIFSMDQEDLYVYELDPTDHGRYRYGQDWERFRTIRERIPVANQANAEADLLFTRHGPVIHVDESRHLAYAVRTAWLEPGMSPYYGSIQFLRASNFRDFKNAVSRFGAPTENQIYADTRGNIGWVVGGLAPKRRNYDGLLPVPGDGRYEWDGFYDGSALPSAYNPSKGFFATANEFNIPANFPLRNELGFEWLDTNRLDRITSVLTANPRSSMDDSARLQNDQLSIPAQRLIALVRGLPAGDPASDMLRSWNGVESVNSNAAAFYEVWLRFHLERAFIAAVVPSAARGLISRPDISVLVDALEHPSPWFGTDALAKRDRLLSSTLATAYEDVTNRLGSQSDTWKWGNLLHSYFEHPLGRVVDDETRARLNVGPFQRGGGSFTVDASGYRASDFQLVSGASFRMLLDVGNWDESRAVNAPGQSGDPTSPHYRDLVGLWSSGAYFPLIYSRAAVERNAEDRIRLLPAGSSDPPK